MDKPLKSSRRPGRKPRITDEVKQEALDLYFGDNDLTTREIAAKCGFATSSLYRILREKGVVFE